MSIVHQTGKWTSRHSAGLAGLILLQFTAAYVIGSEQLLTNDRHSLLPPIGMTAVIPVLAFLAAYAVSPRFRGFVLAQDIRILTMMQHWRVIGFAFLPLYTYGVVPRLFAWPAGLGDVAIGLAALVIIARVDRDPEYVTSAGLVRFHLLGLLDFVVAIATAGLSAGSYVGLTSHGVTSAAMDVWPLNVFPSLIVPGFIILHLTVLLKVRELRKAGMAAVNASAQTA